jgi:outer membrane receptor protein involved in Fe transport
VSGNGSSLSIRGIERGSGTLATTEVHLDGLPLTTSSLRRSLLPPMLDSVQFQRGPRTAIDSFGGLAGAIALHTPRPLPVSTASLQLATLADGDDVSGSIQHGVPSIDLSHQLQAGYSRTPIDIRLADGTESADSEASVLHSRSLWQPAGWPELEGELGLLLQDASPGLSRVVLPAGTTQIDPEALTSTESRPSRIDQRNAAARATLRYQPRESLKFDLALLGAEGDDLLRRATNVQGEVLSREDEESLRSLTLGVLWQGTDYLWLHGEWALTRRHSLTRDRVSSPLEAFFPSNAGVSTSPATRRIFSIAARSDDRSEAPFLSLGVGSDRLGAELGARYHSTERRTSRRVSLALDQADCLLRFGEIIQPCSDEFPGSDSHNEIDSSERNWLPLLRAWWAPGSTHVFSLALRRGLLPGGARLDPSQGSVVPYRAERSDGLDIGHHFENGSWSVRTTVFLNRWSDRQIREQLPAQLGFLIRNGGRAEAYGAELLATWRSDLGIEAWAGVGLLRTRFLSDSALRDDASGAIEGNELPGAPRLTANAGASARWNDWLFSLFLWHSAEAFSDAGNNAAGRRPAHELVDLRAEYAIGERLWVFLGVENLLDEAYVEDIRTGAAGRVVLDFLPGEPRRLLIGAEWRWP